MTGSLNGIKEVYTSPLQLTKGNAGGFFSQWGRGLQDTYTNGAATDAANAAKNLQNSLQQPVTQPKPLPTLDSKSIQDAKLNELRALQSRSGRQSTILTDKFGG